MSTKEVLVRVAKSAFRLFVLFGAIVIANSTDAQDKKVNVAIVVNSGVSVGEISANDVDDLFLGKKSKLGNDSVKIVTLKKGNMHETFLKEFVNKSDKQFDTFWKKLVFTGKAQMPKSFNEEKDLLDYVSKTKGAIGYVAADSPLLKDAKVKTLTLKS